MGRTLRKFPWETIRFLYWKDWVLGILRNKPGVKRIPLGVGGAQIRGKDRFRILKGSGGGSGLVSLCLWQQ